MSLDKPKRFIGLDLHKYYLVAIGVDKEANKVYGPRRVNLVDLEEWIAKTITPEDSLVVEATANAFQVHDALAPHAHSVIIVHPPHLSIIVHARVKTDKKAAYQLARLHAKGLLAGIWVPPQEVRDLRTLVAQRRKMMALKTQAKNRLQGVLHRYSFPLPEGPLFHPDQRSWWLHLPFTKLELVRIESDWDTLEFAERQIDRLEDHMAAWAAQDERIPLLIQLTGIGLITAVTVLAAIGDITRFPDANHLVGYAGLGVRVHDSGLTRHTGGITKAGRRDLRGALVESAQVAVLHDPRWKAELARLEPRLGRNKAIVAITRKLLVVIWHVLTKQEVDRGTDATRMARKYLEFAYRVGKEGRGGRTASAYVRALLDQLGVGTNMTSFRYSGKVFKLPTSSLAPTNE
jgi:transposase